MKIRNNVYRGVKVPKTWAMTSANPGEGCLSLFRSKKAKASLEEVMAYKNRDVVARIARDRGCNIEQAEEIFADVLRFLFMAAQKSAEIGGTIPSPVIDEGWHAFVLFTDDYALFCKKYFGTFLHHAPHRADEQKYTREVLLPSIDAMHAVFGGKPSGNWDFVLA